MKICIARGDGIGPEIMNSVLKILQAVKVKLEYDEIEIGEKAYLSGHATGITDAAFDKIRQNKILLKSPMTTPLGGGYKSINVTLRKKLGLFANIRPVKSYYPFIDCNAHRMDMVIVRENEEDLYSGIEYRATQNSYVALKIISESSSRKIIKYAFEYAGTNGRNKVTCFTKNNIMKLSDGAFARIFDEVSAEYPDIEKNHMLIDIGSARIASKPQDFDVVVTLNLYGDIISDIAAEAAGAVGIAGSANIGNDGYAMFEAVHGSAPDIAGGKANPSGLLSATIMMLRHLNMHDKANAIENALLKTIEDGIHTGDIFKSDSSKKLVSTNEFTDAIITNLGKLPSSLSPVKVTSSNSAPSTTSNTQNMLMEKSLVGCDIYVDNINGFSSLKNAAEIISAKMQNIELHSISHKGLVIWSNTQNASAELAHNNLDMLQLRFVGKNNFSQEQIPELMKNLYKLELEIVMINPLWKYGKNTDGFSKAQGE